MRELSDGVDFFLLRVFYGMCLLMVSKSMFLNRVEFSSTDFVEGSEA